MMTTTATETTLKSKQSINIFWCWCLRAFFSQFNLSVSPSLQFVLLLAFSFLSFSVRFWPESFALILVISRGRKKYQPSNQPTNNTQMSLLNGIEMNPKKYPRLSCRFRSIKTRPIKNSPTTIFVVLIVHYLLHPHRTHTHT